MSKAYCIDVSGSMSTDQLNKAFAFVRKGFEPGDHLIVFDIRAEEVSPDLHFLKVPVRGFGGGTDATECLALAKKLGCYGTVLISDGMMIPEQLAQFNKFIDVEKL